MKQIPGVVFIKLHVLFKAQVPKAQKGKLKRIDHSRDKAALLKNDHKLVKNYYTRLPFPKPCSISSH